MRSSFMNQRFRNPIVSQPGTGPGQSARDTLGTYLDYRGRIRNAGLLELRPNIICQDNAFIQQGYLRESQATTSVPNSADLFTLYSSSTQAGLERIICPISDLLYGVKVTRSLDNSNLWPTNGYWANSYNSFYWIPDDPLNCTFQFTYQAGTNNIAATLTNGVLTFSDQNGSSNNSYDYLGNNCYRIKTKIASNPTYNILVLLPNNNANMVGMTFFGPQSESNGFSSLILTNGTQLTRAAD